MICDNCPLDRDDDYKGCWIERFIFFLEDLGYLRVNYADVDINKWASYIDRLTS